MALFELQVCWATCSQARQPVVRTSIDLPLCMESGLYSLALHFQHRHGCLEMRGLLHELPAEMAHLKFGFAAGDRRRDRLAPPLN
jgi:hypothetical protein